LGTLAAALLFGASTVLATQLGAVALPTQVIYMLPPFITICALIFAGRHMPAPAGSATRTSGPNRPTTPQEKFSA